MFIIAYKVKCSVRVSDLWVTWWTRAIGVLVNLKICLGYVFPLHTSLLSPAWAISSNTGRKWHSARTEIKHNAKTPLCLALSSTMLSFPSLQSVTLCLPPTPPFLISFQERKNRTPKMNNERLASMFYEVATILFWRKAWINENITYLFVSRGEKRERERRVTALVDPGEDFGHYGDHPLLSQTHWDLSHIPQNPNGHR